MVLSNFSSQLSKELVDVVNDSLLNPNNIQEEDYGQLQLQHEQAFGEHSGISNHAREEINNIKRNKYCSDFELSSRDATNFTDLAWKLLGRYIANNTVLKRVCLEDYDISDEHISSLFRNMASNSHLEYIDLPRCTLTDSKLVALFRGLTRSTSIKSLNLGQNAFGMDGVQSMIPS